jgi:RNA polymerase sporulation-specific sigma factor
VELTKGVFPICRQKNTQTALVLLRRFRSGDTAVFPELLDQLEGIVCARTRFYAGFAGAPDSEDLMQEGLLGVLDAIAAYEEGRGASLATFTYLCVNHRLLSALRKEAQRPQTESIQTWQDRLPDPADSQETKVLISEETQRLKELLEQNLTDLEMRVANGYLAERSHSEIARDLHISDKAVDNALQRIRHKLRGKR